MAAGATYTPIATTTLGSSSASYTFTSIPTTYTDIILIAQGIMTSNARIDLLMGNGSVDTGSNYSNTEMYGDGTNAYSQGRSNNSTMQGIFDGQGAGTGQFTFAAHFMNYANTSTYKTVLGRYASVTGGSIGATVGLWRSTAAINTIKIQPTSNFAAGIMFTLYGIASA